MTIDKSLKIKAGSAKQRSVLTRGERLANLKENDRWTEGDRVIGLPKVRVIKLSMKKKKKAKAAEGEEGAAASGAAPAAKPAAKSAAGAAKPAAGAAKPAAKPAAKK